MVACAESVYMPVVNSAIGCFKFYSQSANKHLILSGLILLFIIQVQFEVATEKFSLIPIQLFNVAC